MALTAGLEVLFGTLWLNQEREDIFNLDLVGMVNCHFARCFIVEESLFPFVLVAAEDQFAGLFQDATPRGFDDQLY